MTHALALTRSSVAFMGLTDDAGSYERVYSRAADTSRTSMPDEAQRLIAGETSSSNPVVSARLLEAAGEHPGMIAVAPHPPTPHAPPTILAILPSPLAPHTHPPLL